MRIAIHGRMAPRARNAQGPPLRGQERKKEQWKHPSEREHARRHQEIADGRHLWGAA
jgi:hypothetical protein